MDTPKLIRAAQSQYDNKNGTAYIYQYQIITFNKVMKRVQAKPRRFLTIIDRPQKLNLPEKFITGKTPTNEQLESAINHGHLGNKK